MTDATQALLPVTPGSIKSAVLDLPFANIAPIEWDEDDWHQACRVLTALYVPKAHSLLGDAGMRAALTDIFAAWDAHVAANDRTNEVIPPIGATRAEREVYAERYKASEDAKRDWFASMHRFVNNPATRAALTPSALSGDAGDGE